MSSQTFNYDNASAIDALNNVKNMMRVSKSLQIDGEHVLVGMLEQPIMEFNKGDDVFVYSNGNSQTELVIRNIVTPFTPTLLTVFVWDVLYGPTRVHPTAIC